MTVVPYDTISTTSIRESVFTKCCCCIPLRLGCLILGYLNLIFNLIHTLSVLTITAYIGFFTNWFNHVDTERPRVMEDQSIGIKQIERRLLIHVEWLMLMALFTNVAWLIINVLCLVGLHKKRPGPIKVYIRVALIRLILMFLGLVYIIGTDDADKQRVLSYCVDWCLAAYFIFVYYVYASSWNLNESGIKKRKGLKMPILFILKKSKRKYWSLRC